MWIDNMQIMKKNGLLKRTLFAVFLIFNFSLTAVTAQQYTLTDADVVVNDGVI